MIWTIPQKRLKSSHQLIDQDLLQGKKKKKIVDQEPHSYLLNWS